MRVLHGAACSMATARPSLDDLAPRTVRGLQPVECGRCTAAPVADVFAHEARQQGTASPQPSPIREAGGFASGAEREGSNARVFDFPVAASSTRARPTSPAPSTPRAASCSSCASAWRNSACASSPSIWPPAASPRRPACTRARWRGTIRKASRPCSAATAAMRGQRHGHRPSSTSCARGATSAASSRPAARAAPRWPRRRCARCPSACPR